MPTVRVGSGYQSPAQTLGWLKEQCVLFPRKWDLLWQNPGASSRQDCGIAECEIVGLQDYRVVGLQEGRVQDYGTAEL